MELTTDQSWKKTCYKKYRYYLMNLLTKDGFQIIVKVGGSAILEGRISN